MGSLSDKIRQRNRRKGRIRKKIHGTAQRPRLTVFKSHKYLYLQAINDEEGRTLATASTLKLGVRPNIEGGVALGKLMAEELKKAQVSVVVFDRNGYKFHGVVKAIADNIHEGGIEV
ncbi:50S ribosomal protein L18 [Candidatus Haliotispira prima]|uniref:Large ribosomal subunit protein uL18 n=1 Tax=Candidatus Haliotispira prima TaxID=3034016 RepID=A0ABY8MG18_9SPIO|nr:50S ribosomal protein L18 [Candidatus Haliotispira prima]